MVAKKAHWRNYAKRRWNDPQDDGNSPEWWTGKLCIKCHTYLAGTFWSEALCRRCNAERLNALADKNMAAKRAKREPKGAEYVPAEWPEEALEAAAELLGKDLK